MGFTSLAIAISTFLLKEWESLYGIVTKLFSFSAKNQGIYEIIDYDTTLELSATGKTATFLKRQKIKFLQDNIISFQDFAWGEGEMFENYKCSPGVVADRYFVGDRWNILISLRETKSRGDIEEFFIQSTFKDAYVNSSEWHQVEIRHDTKHLKMTIQFPKRRHCKRATIHRRHRKLTTELGPEHFSTLPDGRQVVIWEASNVKPLEVYTLRWEW
ncbi:MAG: hypothetical protein AAF702_43345 [Chloroflexota bacterium]